MLVTLDETGSLSQILREFGTSQGQLCFLILVELDASKSKLVSIFGGLAIFEHLISLVTFAFSNIALSHQVFYVFVLNLSHQSLAKERSVSKQLVVQTCLHRLDKLVLHKTVKCMVVFGDASALSLIHI